MTLNSIWVLAEASDGTVSSTTLELLTKARELASSVGAVYVGGDADATVDLSGSTTLYGSLYAPRAAVAFTGSGQLAGALFTRNLDVSGSLTVSSGAATTPPPSCQQPPSEPPAGGTAPGTEVVQ